MSGHLNPSAPKVPSGDDQPWKSIIAYLLAVACGACGMMLLSGLLMGRPEWYTLRYVVVGLAEFFLIGLLTTMPLCVPLFWREARRNEPLTVGRGLALGAIGAGGAWLLLALLVIGFSGLVSMMIPALAFIGVAAVGGAIGGAAFAAIKQRLRNP